MKNLTNQLIAFFLLLCFAVTIVPLNTFHNHSHNHSEKTHCDINDEIHSDDACHFSLYHNQLEEKHCDHNAHFSDNDVECELCKMLNSQRDDYSILKQNNKLTQKHFSVLVALNLEHHEQSFSDLFYNKGPPNII
ncbi:hypothetical protein N9242_06580 [Vicingaceae bacterium]|nr:hypothetical protein [Vicingaceae bacterium]